MSGQTITTPYEGPLPSTTVEVEGAPSLASRISWGAIFAGAVVALSIALMLNVLGTAIAAMLVDTTTRETPSATSFGIGGAVWLVVSHLIAMGFGGYAAARLSGTADGTDGTLHGVAVWGTTVLVSAVLIGNVVAGAASMAASGASSIVGGLANGTGSLMSEVGQQAANRTSTSALQSTTQGMIDRAQNALSGGGNPASMTPDQRKAEIGTLVGRRVTDGDLSAADRDRLNNLVAAESGITPQEAQQRVQQMEQQTTQAVQQAKEKARQAADATAKGTYIASFSIFGVMLLGLIAAILGSRSGTRAMLARRRVVRDYL